AAGTGGGSDERSRSSTSSSVAHVSRGPSWESANGSNMAPSGGSGSSSVRGAERERDSGAGGRAGVGKESSRDPATRLAVVMTSASPGRLFATATVGADSSNETSTPASLSSRSTMASRSGGAPVTRRDGDSCSRRSSRGMAAMSVSPSSSSSPYPDAAGGG